MHLSAKLALAALIAPCFSLHAQRITGPNPSKSVPAPVILDEAGKFQSKFARVGSDMYISGQPTADALRQLHDQGVRTVVNLRLPDEMEKIGFDEAALVASLGMKYVYLPVRGNAEYPYSPSTVAKFTEAMKSANGSVLLHCTVAWRASHLWAAYLIKERGVAPDSALAFARSINLMDEHHDGTGRQPVEDFLGRDLPELRRARTP